jgi:hypothetical protein
VSPAQVTRWRRGLGIDELNARRVVTLFDRAARSLTVASLSPLTIDHPGVRDTAELLGLAFPVPIGR